MFILLALLGRLAALLPQSWRAHAEQKVLNMIEQRISRASPNDAARLLRLGDALLATAETDDEIWDAIGFLCRTRATLAQRDRSGHFNRHKPRRMRFTRRRERARTINPPPSAFEIPTLDLSG